VFGGMLVTVLFVRLSRSIFHVKKFSFNRMQVAELAVDERGTSFYQNHEVHLGSAVSRLVYWNDDKVYGCRILAMMENRAPQCCGEVSTYKFATAVVPLRKSY